MQNAGWIALFRRIPPVQHNSLLLTTVIGSEIVLQRIIRLEPDFMVIQGRISGSTDQGMMHVLPFDQLAFVTFTKKMTDVEMLVAVGNPGAADQLPEAEADGTQQAEEPIAVPAPPVPAKTPAPAVTTEPAAPATAAKTAPPSKSVLLARLRQRLATDIAKQSNPNP